MKSLFLFRIAVVAVLLLIQLYFYLKAERFAREHASNHPSLRLLVKVPFILFNVPLVYLAIAQIRIEAASDFVLYAAVYPFYLWHGALFFMFLVLLAVELIRLPVRVALWLANKVANVKAKISGLKATPSYAQFDRSRRRVLKTGFYGLSAYAFGGVAYGLVERDQLEVNERRISIADLPDSLQGLSIALICDVHSGIFMTKSKMQEYARIVNSLNADMIVVPGDFVTFSVDEVYPFVEAFCELRAPLGVYGCLGNHEFYADRSGDLITKELEQGGMRVLRNESIVIESGGEAINLIGVDDIGRTMNAEAIVDQSLKGARPECPTIFLCHKPYYFDAIASRNVDLTLSGHTHGGQVVLAQLGRTSITPASLFSPYVWGLYEQNRSKMYVTKGVGVIGVPFRINCPPEIAKIVLEKA